MGVNGAIAALMRIFFAARAPRKPSNDLPRGVGVPPSPRSVRNHPPETEQPRRCRVPWRSRSHSWWHQASQSAIGPAPDAELPMFKLRQDDRDLRDGTPSRIPAVRLLVLQLYGWEAQRML